MKDPVINHNSVDSFKPPQTDVESEAQTDVKSEKNGSQLPVYSLVLGGTDMEDPVIDHNSVDSFKPPQTDVESEAQTDVKSEENGLQLPVYGLVINESALEDDKLYYKNLGVMLTVFCSIWMIVLALGMWTKEDIGRIFSKRELKPYEIALVQFVPAFLMWLIFVCHSPIWPYRGMFDES